MSRKRILYYTDMSPFAVLGLALLGLGAFFLTLPILIGALLVFVTLAAYMAWRFTRALKKAQKDMLKEQQIRKASGFEGCDIIIDVTPESGKRPGIEDGNT